VVVAVVWEGGAGGWFGRVVWEGGLGGWVGRVGCARVWRWRWWGYVGYHWGGQEVRDQVIHRYIDT